MTRRPPQDAGFSLMELVVVMAVFALVAIMGLQALSGTLRQRDRLVEIDTSTAALMNVMTLMRSDLQAGVPLLFHASDGAAQSAFDISPNQNSFAISVSGKQDLPGEFTAGLGRVTWHLDPASGNLTRQSWPVLNPADSGVASPKVVVATKISRLSFRILSPERIWIAGKNMIAGNVSSTLPKAVEVSLSTQTHGVVRLLVSYP